jgi:hypothetical protein
MKKLVGFALAVLFSLTLLSVPMAWGATSLSLSGVFWGEPDIFIPGLGLSAELPLTRSLGLFAGAQFFLSGSWDLLVGVMWHPSQRFAVYVQALFLFDVIDEFVPQLGVGLRWSFPLSRSFEFFNGLTLNVPLVSRFLQPAYAAGLTLVF